MMASRQEVYAIIDGERDYQDAGMGNARRHADMPDLTPGEMILIMEELLSQARAVWYKPDGGKECLHDIRKAAAVGVQMMERFGAPPRGSLPTNTRENWR